MTRPTTKRPTPRALAAAAEDERLATLSDDDRARALAARFGVFEGPINSEDAVRRLVAMGAAAIPALIDTLDDRDTGSQAAFTLAQIGAPGAADAAATLWRLASDPAGSPASMWSTQALARLGLLDRVSSLLEAGTDARNFNVAQALAAVTPTSYPWIERALDRGDPGFAAAAADALRPGRVHFFDPESGAFEAAVLGAASAHAVVRMDAALVLVHKAFPRAARPRAVAELRRLARDPESEVRRLAALSLGLAGKAVAAAAREGLEGLIDDRVATVREAARYGLGQLSTK